jgi:hypothetical protein
MYGSPRYLARLKEGWKVKPEEEERAKAYQQLAASDTMPPRKSKAAPAEPAAPTTEVAPSKPARKVRVSKKVASAAVIQDPPLPVQPIVTEAPTLVEAMTAPITPYEVVKVKVKKIRLEGKDCFYAPATGKVYTIGSHGMPEKYKGRYVPPADSEGAAKLDPTYPDSDAE